MVGGEEVRGLPMKGRFGWSNVNVIVIMLMRSIRMYHNTPKANDVCSYPSERTGLYDGSSLRAFIAKVAAAPPSAAYPMDEGGGLLGFGPTY